MKWVLLFVLAAFNAETAICKSYENFKVYDILCVKPSDVKSLRFWEQNPLIDFWTLPGVSKTARVLVAPSLETDFEKFLSYENFNYKILIENVGQTFKSHRRNELKFHFQNGNFDETVRDFSHYWTLPEIESYIDFLAQSTDLNVQKVIIGKSFEGRNIHALTISLDETVGNQPVLFIDAGIHAREWAGHMSVLYLLHQLVENYSANMELLRNVDWVVVPVVNPDGFVYTHEEDRFWRKNRRPINDECVGVDINRNFATGWKDATDETSPCTLTYPGPSPNSKPETKALADLMMQYKNKIKLYVSMHSFASFILYPYSFDVVYIANWKQHQQLCKIYADTVNRITKFEPFTFGHSASEFYPASGVSDDFVVIEAQAKLSIVVELPGGGTRGFDFPEEDIEDLVKETFEGLKALGVYVSENF